MVRRVLVDGHFSLRGRIPIERLHVEGELVAISPVAAIKDLLNAQAVADVVGQRLICLVVVLEGDGLLGAANDGAVGDAVGRVVARVSGHGVRGGEAVLVGLGLRHREGGVRRQALNHGALAVLEGDGTAVSHFARADRLLAGLIHVVGELARQRLVTVEVDGELKAVLALLGLVGGVAPVDALLDLQLAGSGIRDLAVVAKVLRYGTVVVPTGNQYVQGSAGGVTALKIFLLGNQRMGSIGALGIGRHIRPTLLVILNLAELDASAHDGHALGRLRGGAAFGLPIGIGVVHPVVVSDVAACGASAALLIHVQRGVLRVVIELVTLARLEGSHGQTVGGVLRIRVGVEVDGAFLREVILLDGVVHIARTGVDGVLRILLHAHAIEKTDGIGVRHRHGLLVGVNVVVAHGDEGGRNLYGYLIARGEIAAASNRHSEV